MQAPPAPLRIGIIGGGFMGRRHAGFIAAEPATELAAVADPFSKDLAGDFRVPHFSDHRDLLAGAAVDAVIIANPNTTHVATALDCLEAGIPALLEKPVATSLDEVRPLVEAQRQNPVPLLVGHHRRHHPAAAAARRVLADGGLGRLVAVSGMWVARKADSYFDVEWRRRRGAGVLLINLVHDLDLLRFICGEINAVQARASNSVRSLDVEDTASLILEFDGGALGSFVVSDAAVSPWGWDQAIEDDPAFPHLPAINCYSIACTAGSLSFPQLARYSHPDAVRQAGAADWNHPLTVSYEHRGPGDSYTNQLRHFAAVARGGQRPLVTVEDAARTLALVEAARLASESGASVAVADVLAGSLG